MTTSNDSASEPGEPAPSADTAVAPAYEEMPAKPGVKESPSAGAKAWRLVELDDISIAGRRRATARIVVRTTELPGRDRLQQIAHQVWKAHGGPWHEFTTFLYLPEMNTHGAAYGVAEFEASGLQEMTVNDTSLFATPWYEQSDMARKQRDAERDWEKQREDPGAQEYSFDLKAKVVDDRELTVSCATNLPEGTRLSITASRIYWLKGALDEYGGYVIDEDLSVEDGKVEVASIIDDKPWMKDWERRARILRSVGEPADIREISKEIRVRVLYTSHNKNHPRKVREILGKNGEYVRGRQAKRVGKGTCLEVEATVRASVRR